MVKLQQQLTRLQARFDILARDHAALLTQHDARGHALAEAQATIAQLRAENAALQLTLARKTEDLDRLIVTVADKNHRLLTLLRKQFASSKRERFVAGQHIIAEIAPHLEAADYAALLAEYKLKLVDGVLVDISRIPDATPAAAADASSDATGSADQSATTDKKAAEEKAKPKNKRPPGSGGRKSIPADYPRQTSNYHAPADHPALQGATQVTVIGRKTIEQFSATSAHIFVNVLTCDVVRIVKAGCTMQVLLTPPAVVERGQVSDALLVHTVVDKTVDHLPAYRQEQRAARYGLDIPRNKLCRWTVALAQHLRPIYDAQLVALMREPCLGIDDSPTRRWDLGKGRGRCAIGRIWAVSAQGLGYYYLSTDTREGKWITQLLEHYSGDILGDGYSGHNQLLLKATIMALFCWAHARRYFFDAPNSTQREEMLALIGCLYDIERDIATCTPAEKTFQRQRRALPILRGIKQRLDGWYNNKTILPTGELGKAVRYALNHWDGLERYALPGHGHAAIDNNLTEQAMRPNAMHRKNSLFHASPAGAEAHAIHLTLCHSALHLGLNPEHYLAAITQALHQPGANPADLIPARYAIAHPEAILRKRG